MDDIVLASKLNGSLSFYKLDVLFTYPSNEYYNGITKHRRGSFLYRIIFKFILLMNNLIGKIHLT